MADNELKLILRAKVFFSLALAAFLLGNAIALFTYYVFATETPSYTAENIQPFCTLRPVFIFIVKNTKNNNTDKIIPKTLNIMSFFVV